MPRKTKKEELSTWLNEYAAFHAEVDFVTYKAQIVVLAKDYVAAIDVLKAKYPNCPTPRILSQLISIVL